MISWEAYFISPFHLFVSNWGAIQSQNPNSKFIKVASIASWYFKDWFNVKPQETIIPTSMIKRTLYFGHPARLSLKDNQLVAQIPEFTDINGFQSKERTVTVPVEDVGVVLLDHSQIALTHALINYLMQNNAVVIPCNEKHLPSGYLLPLVGSTLQQERYEAQVSASLPLKKQLWQQIIQAKIGNQAGVLQELGQDFEPLLYYKRSVRSGDPDNYEARAAAFYWQRVFGNQLGEGFTRGRFEDDPNNLLNYGYAVLRAVVARSLVAAGLIPTLGIHHHNRYNPFCLADDIMEPYRPYVDRVVARVLAEVEDVSILTREIKAKLLVIPAVDAMIDGRNSPLMLATQRTANSLVECFEGKSRKLLLPLVG